MTTFDDREKAFESRFAHDADMQFRVMARRNRLVGEWAAGLLGLSDADTEAYAKAVVQADFEEAGDEDVVRKLIGDLLKGGVSISETDVRTAMSDTLATARAQISGV